MRHSFSEGWTLQSWCRAQHPIRCFIGLSVDYVTDSSCPALYNALDVIYSHYCHHLMRPRDREWLACNHGAVCMLMAYALQPRLLASQSNILPLVP